MSHPVRVRGLKLLIFLGSIYVFKSHPVRVRGLKSEKIPVKEILPQVAPRAGAWIEIPLLK